MLSLSQYTGGGNGSYVSLDNIIIPAVNTPSLDNSWKSMPTYANSWTSFGAPFAPMQFYRNPNGRVYVRGLIKSGTSGLTIGPNLNRASIWAAPLKQMIQVGIGNAGSARIDAIPPGTTAGSVFVNNYWNSGTNGYVSLGHQTWDTRVR
jgi:hypothetical protein